jgi:hypothetical protein
MDTQEAIDYFGGRKGLYKALELGGYPAIGAWGPRPPMGRQWQIELITNGNLRADDYARRVIVKTPQAYPVKTTRAPSGKRKAAKTVLVAHAEAVPNAVPERATAGA